MAKVPHDRLDVHCDDRLVLNDKYVGESLPFDLLEGFSDQRINVVGRSVDEVRGVIGREAFEGRQQQRLAGQRGDPRKPRLSDSFRANRALDGFFALLDIGGRPDRVEGLVKTKPRVDVTRKFVRLGDDRLQRRANECVAVRLAASQGAGVAAEEWQVRGKFLAKGHDWVFSLESSNLRRLRRRT